MYRLRRRPLRVHTLSCLSVVQEFDSRHCKAVGPQLVAKESKRVEYHDLKSTFHNIFAKTQATAMQIAKSFNVLVKEQLSTYNPGKFTKLRVWDISFLPCCVYSFLEDGVERCILSEKRLMPADRYTKWNGNNGYVHSLDQPHPNPAEETSSTMKTLTAYGRKSVDAMVGTSDKAGGGSGNCVPGRVDHADLVDYGTGAEDYKAGLVEISSRRVQSSPCFHPRPEDFLQAFSHFSYWSSGCRMLVCDLQGVLSEFAPPQGICAGVFELTDPVIHYESTSGRQQVFGNTDLGKRGMRRFFETHTCNDVCRLLCLPSSRSSTIRTGSETANAQHSASSKRQRF